MMPYSMDAQMTQTSYYPFVLWAVPRFRRVISYTAAQQSVTSAAVAPNRGVTAFAPSRSPERGDPVYSHIYADRPERRIEVAAAINPEINCRLAS